MMSSMMTSLNQCQKISSLSRNSCAKAFGNSSRGKNFRLKIPRGGSTNPPCQFNLVVVKNRNIKVSYSNSSSFQTLTSAQREEIFVPMVCVRTPRAASPVCVTLASHSQWTGRIAEVCKMLPSSSAIRQNIELQST